LHNKYDNFSMCSWKEEEVAASKLVLTERPNVYTWLPVAATPPQWLEVGWEFPGLQLVCAASMAAHKLPKYFNFNFGGGPEGKTHAGSKWIGGSVDPWIRGSVAWQMQPPTMLLGALLKSWSTVPALIIYATHQFSYFIRVQIVPRPILRVGVAIASSANLTRFHFLIIITLARTLGHGPWHSPSGKGSGSGRAYLRRLNVI